MKAIDDQFVTFDKAFVNTHIMQFSSLKLHGIRGVCDHIMRMRDIVTQLKALEVTMSDSFPVHMNTKRKIAEHENFQNSFLQLSNLHLSNQKHKLNYLIEFGLERNSNEKKIKFQS